MADAPKRKSWWKIALLLVVFLGAAGGAIDTTNNFVEHPDLGLTLGEVRTYPRGVVALVTRPAA